MKMVALPPYLMANQTSPLTISLKIWSILNATSLNKRGQILTMAKKRRETRRSRTTTQSTPRVRTPPSRGLPPTKIQTFLKRLTPPAVIIQRAKNRLFVEPIIPLLPKRAQKIYRERHLYKRNPENLCRLLRSNPKSEPHKNAGAGRRSFFYIRALRILSHCRS